jgi:hypothetical protein
VLLLVLLLGRCLLGLGTLLLSLLLLLELLLGSLGLGGLGTVVLGSGSGHGLLLLGLDDGDGVRKTGATSLLASGVVGRRRGAHDLDLDTEHTLPEQNVTGGVVNEVLSGLTGVDHEAVGELHGLGTGGAQLAGDDNLATLGAGLHNETVVKLEVCSSTWKKHCVCLPEDTVACTTNGKTVEKLVAEGLALGDSGETAGLDLSGVKGDAVRGELVTVGDQAGKLWMLLDIVIPVISRHSNEHTSRILRPCSPRTSWVWVARMMMSVTVGVTRTSTPEYPSSASSRWKNSFNSA